MNQHNDGATLPVSERFAANLKKLREVARLPQEELAVRAGIHRTQISLIEGGHRMPRLDTLIKLAGALGVTPNDLLDGIVWEPSQHRPGRFISDRIEGEVGMTPAGA
jgi:transcriptional regulator with XRE-family HTH domain